MSFRASQLEDIGNWCATSEELAPFRAQARREFFGEDDPRRVAYWPGAGDPTSRERRFVGWFNWRLDNREAQERWGLPV
jgi:hypothetical protein